MGHCVCSKPALFCWSLSSLLNIAALTDFLFPVNDAKHWASHVVASGKEPTYQCRRPEFDPWVRKTPWRRKWQLTPVFLPGKSHGQRSLVGYSPWGLKESDKTKGASYSCMPSAARSCIKKSSHAWTGAPPLSSRIVQWLFSGAVCKAPVVCRVPAWTYGYVWSPSCTTSFPNPSRVQSHEHLIWRAGCRGLRDHTAGVGAEEAGPLDSLWFLMTVASGTGSYANGATAGTRTQNKPSGQVSGEKQDITGQEICQMCAGEEGSIVLSQCPSTVTWCSLMAALPLMFLFSGSVVSDSLWSHGLQHARLPCPSPSPGICSNSCPLRQWWRPTISSSVLPFSSCLQPFPASGSLPVGWLLAAGGQSFGASAHHQSFQWIFKVDFL